MLIFVVDDYYTEILQKGVEGGGGKRKGEKNIVVGSVKSRVFRCFFPEKKNACSFFKQGWSLENLLALLLCSLA